MNADCGRPERRVRDATAADAAACAAIYRPYVLDTVVSFELEPPTAADMAERIATAQQRHAWLVLVDGAGVRGYAYGSSHRPRNAYRWAAEVSVYVAPDSHRTGVGRALYGTLLTRLGARGFRRALAGIALPNPGSDALHRALGFETVGVYRRIGWKFGSWHDVLWCERDLGDGPADSPPANLR